MEKLFESRKRRKLCIFWKMYNYKHACPILTNISCQYFKTNRQRVYKITNRYNFLLDKTDRIKRNTLIGDILDGGIGIIDLESKLQALKAIYTIL